MKPKSLALFSGARRVLVAACAVLALGLAASTAEAGTVLIASGPATAGGGVGSFTGSLTYDYDAGAGTGTLSVTLANTSATSNGGYLTGFVFNVAGAASASLSTGPSSDWQNLSGWKALTLPPYGIFEAGASTSNKVLSNKNASDGIAAGDSATFTFAVTGSGASSLDAADFVTDLAWPGVSGDPFMARFGAFDDGDSDKVGASIVVVPLPPAGLAGLMMLLGLGAAHVRRRRRSVV